MVLTFDLVFFMKCGRNMHVLSFNSLFELSVMFLPQSIQSVTTCFDFPSPTGENSLDGGTFVTELFFWSPCQ